MLTGLCFHLKLRKCNEDLFFGRHEGKLETFAKICVVASLETLREDPTVRIRDKQAAWKLLSEISRTAPGTTVLYDMHMRVCIHYHLTKVYVALIIGRCIIIKVSSTINIPALFIFFIYDEVTVTLDSH